MIYSLGFFFSFQGYFCISADGKSIKVAKKQPTKSTIQVVTFVKTAVIIGKGEEEYKKDGDYSPSFILHCVPSCFGTQRDGSVVLYAD